MPVGYFFMNSKVTITGRGTFEMRLGGKTRTFRYRAHELKLLENRSRKNGGKSGIFSILDEGNLGLTFLSDAIIVGVAHEFIGKRGRQKEVLTEELVEKWIDNSAEVDDLTFDELLGAIVTGVVAGMPGAEMKPEENTDSPNELPAE